jgi:lysophospholipase L1-like esterase
LRRTLFLVYFNISLLCVLLAGLELTGQVVFYLWKGYPVYESDQHLISHADVPPFELHPFLVGRLRGGARFNQNGKTLTSTQHHTRWTGAPDSAAVRIAVVGGSTTFGAGVTDSATWPARLQALLGPGYAVTNYGMPGFSSAEGAIQMALLVPESRPGLVVIYEGWNDLHNFHDSALGPDYYSHGLRQYSNLDIQRPHPTGLFTKLVEISAICRLAWVAANSLAPDQSAEPATPADLTGPPDSIPDLFIERMYRRNLGSMRVLAEQAGAYVLFIPQVMDSSRMSGDASGFWTPRIRNSAMSAMLHRVNGILAESCPDGDTRCAVLDVAPMRAWRSGDFIDEGHFSPEGNDAFARVVADWVNDAARRGLVPPEGASPVRAGSPP